MCLLSCVQLFVTPWTAYLGLISFKIDWLDLLAVQGTLKSLLQHHTSLCSLFGRKDMTNLVYKKQRCYFANKVRLVKAKAFPVVKYGYESWTKNKIKHQRTDAFQLWCSKRLMTVPWTARRSNQSILNKISSEHSMETLTLALKLQYFGHWIQRADSLEKTLMLGKVEVGRRRE